MSEIVLSVAQARIQLYPIMDRFDQGIEEVVHIKSRSGSDAVLMSAAFYAKLVDTK